MIAVVYTAPKKNIHGTDGKGTVDRFNSFDQYMQPKSPFFWFIGDCDFKEHGHAISIIGCIAEFDSMEPIAGLCTRTTSTLDILKIVNLASRTDVSFSDMESIYTIARELKREFQPKLTRG